MPKQLLPIFQYWVDAIIELNPNFDKQKRDAVNIVASAAHDHIVRNNPTRDYARVANDYFKYTTDENIKSENDMSIHMQCYLTLAYYFKSDVTSGIINNAGEIINPTKLVNSKIMNVPFKREKNGLPCMAQKTMTRAIYNGRQSTSLEMDKQAKRAKIKRASFIHKTVAKFRGNNGL